MRKRMVLMFLVFLAGCTESTPSVESSPAQTVTTEKVLLNDAYSTNSVQPATFSIQVATGTTNIRYEMTQDSGALPNIHLELTGCGSADPPAAGAAQGATLCQTAQAGSQTFTMSVQGGSVAGTGRIVLRADVPA